MDLKSSALKTPYLKKLIKERNKLLSYIGKGIVSDDYLTREIEKYNRILQSNGVYI